MVSIDALAKAVEKAVSEGDMAFVADMIDVPNSVYLGKKLVYFSDKADLTGMLMRYRGNLLKLGYARTVFSNIKSSIVGPETVSVKLDWTNLDRAGYKISDVGMRCYLLRQPPSGWRVTLVSFNAMPAPAVLEGLAVY